MHRGQIKILIYLLDVPNVFTIPGQILVTHEMLFLIDTADPNSGMYAEEACPLAASLFMIAEKLSRNSATMFKLERSSRKNPSLNSRLQYGSSVNKTRRRILVEASTVGTLRYAFS
uniref:Uncharacterized protein n=2 Tax=Physcomitrium patens TaxID=3218 RepID=A0A2K1IEZ7_PHYPA|nr:hypothetical protein PHYPA_030004 [Physcomitrium patens]